MRWLPPILWTCVILAASNDLFSSAHTGSLLRTLLETVFGRMSDPAFEIVHFSIRKLSHLTEYAILSALLFRAFRGEHHGWRRGWALRAVVFAAVVASADEIHQASVPSRTASPIDVAIDIAGAGLAQGLTRVSSRRMGRPSSIPAE